MTLRITVVKSSSRAQAQGHAGARDLQVAVSDASRTGFYRGFPLLGAVC